MYMVKRIDKLVQSHGELERGKGMVTGVIALILAVLCVFGVLAFHFPQYLTMPELRQKYNVDMIRQIMLGAMVISGSIAVFNILFNRNRVISSMAFCLLVFAALMGGHKVEVGDFPTNTPYIGLDWLILDLLGSALLFIFIEKMFAYRKDQPVFRPEWQTDLVHFVSNHLMVGLVLLIVNRILHTGFGWAVVPSVQSAIRGLPNLVELLLLILVADLMQYWTHRAMHEIPYLWRFHAVHHSVKTMDWLAGSRLHILEPMLTRTAVLIPVYILGFSQSVMDWYIIIVGFQAVFNHANVSTPLGPLKYVFVTPNFHHWHHAQDDEALDKNYAAHYSFLDYLFGTAVKSTKVWPEQYGVKGDYMPPTYIGQQLFPFVHKTEITATPKD
jgi:sterol desaturase/sphingolipid hydroxylase (fatty acid hydroxylase superfamily)